MTGVRQLGRHEMLSVMLSLAALLLAGCDITVYTRVAGNGTVRRNIAIEVPTEDFDLARTGAQQYLREGWNFTSREKVGMRELICSRKFKADDAEVMKSITFDRRLSWWIPIARFHYKEEVSLQKLLRSKDKQQMAEQTRITYLLTLPGSIDAPNASKVQGSTAMWQAKANKDLTLEARSTAIRWWWGAFELIVIAFIVWAVMPVINWFNTTLTGWRDQRKTARVEKTRRREEAAMLKAQKVAAKESIRQQQELERQREKEKRDRAQAEAEQQKASQQAEKEAERQRREAEKQRAREEAQRKKEEGRRIKEEKRNE